MSSTLKKLNDEVESLALKAEMVDPGDMGRLSQRKAFAKLLFLRMIVFHERG